MLIKRSDKHLGISDEANPLVLAIINGVKGPHKGVAKDPVRGVQLGLFLEGDHAGVLVQADLLKKQVVVGLEIYGHFV